VLVLAVEDGLLDVRAGETFDGPALCPGSSWSSRTTSPPQKEEAQNIALGEKFAASVVNGSVSPAPKGRERGSGLPAP